MTKRSIGEDCWGKGFEPAKLKRYIAATRSARAKVSRPNFVRSPDKICKLLDSLIKLCDLNKDDIYSTVFFDTDVHQRSGSATSPNDDTQWFMDAMREDVLRNIRGSDLAHFFREITRHGLTEMRPRSWACESVELGLCDFFDGVPGYTDPHGNVENGFLPFADVDEPEPRLAALTCLPSVPLFRLPSHHDTSAGNTMMEAELVRLDEATAADGYPEKGSAVKQAWLEIRLALAPTDRIGTPGLLFEVRWITALKARFHRSSSSSDLFLPANPGLLRDPYSDLDWLSAEYFGPRNGLRIMETGLAPTDPRPPLVLAEDPLARVAEIAENENMDTSCEYLYLPFNLASFNMLLIDTAKHLADLDMPMLEMPWGADPARTASIFPANTPASFLQRMLDGRHEEEPVLIRALRETVDTYLDALDRYLQTARQNTEAALSRQHSDGVDNRADRLVNPQRGDQP